MFLFFVCLFAVYWLKYNLVQNDWRGGVSAGSPDRGKDAILNRESAK